MKFPCWTVLAISWAAAVSASAAEEALSWVPIGAPPGTFRVDGDEVDLPAGAAGVLRSQRPYQNFILEFDRPRPESPGPTLLLWADGLPAKGSDRPRGVEVHLPSAPHYRLEAAGGRVRLLGPEGETVLVRGAPLRCGYLCFESGALDGVYRGFQLTVLPSAAMAPDQIADPADGFRPLCPGPGLEGWKVADVTAQVWHAEGTHLLAANVDTPRAAGEPDLWTQKHYRDFELIVDWRLTMKPVPRALPTFTADGLFAYDQNGKVIRRTIPNAGDSGVYLRGSPRYQVNIWSQPMGSGDINELHKDPKVPVEIRRAAMPATHADAPFGEWNRFYIRLEGDRLDVTLNEIPIIDHAQMLGIAAEGPLALQHEFHGSPIEFANLYIHELNRSAAGGETPLSRRPAN